MKLIKKEKNIYFPTVNNTIKQNSNDWCTRYYSSYGNKWKKKNFYDIIYNVYK